MCRFLKTESRKIEHHLIMQGKDLDWAKCKDVVLSQKDPNLQTKLKWTGQDTSKLKEEKKLQGPQFILPNIIIRTSQQFNYFRAHRKSWPGTI